MTSMSEKMGNISREENPKKKKKKSNGNYETKNI